MNLQLHSYKSHLNIKHQNKLIVRQLYFLFMATLCSLALLFTGITTNSWAAEKAGTFSITGFHYDASHHVILLQTTPLPKDYTTTDHRFTRIKQPDNELVVSFPRAKVGLPKNKAIPISANGLKSAMFIQPSEYSGTLVRIGCESQDAISNIQFVSSPSSISIYINPSKGQKLISTEKSKVTTISTIQPLKEIKPNTVTKPGALKTIALPVPSTISTSKTTVTKKTTTTTTQSTGNSKPASIAPNLAPSMPPANLITNAELTKAGILIHAQSGNSLIVKERMSLDKPSRLVLDIADAGLENIKLKTPLIIQNPLMHQVRFGQFDANTVRVVINADIPNRLMVTYPGEDKNTLLISGDIGGQSYNSLPDKDEQIGAIQDIWVESKGENKASIKISATAPMVRLLEHQDNKIKIQFVNLFGREAPVYFDKTKFPFINKIQVSPQQANEPNVKLVVTLDRDAFNLNQYLSQDGKYLEISLEMLKPKVTADTTNTSSAEDWMFTRIPGKKLVVVDAGHGGKDVGATREGIYEKNMTLSIALKVRDELQKLGYQVVMTRSVDKFLELSEITGITNKVKPDVFVSVHINSSTNPSIHGIETYYFTPQSRALADAVHKQMTSKINAPDRYVRSARFYVVRHTEVPAILCETGYISNSVERNDLLTASRQQATAEAIARGVTFFLNQKKSIK